IPSSVTSFPQASAAPTPNLSLARAPSKGAVRQRVGRRSIQVSSAGGERGICLNCYCLPKLSEMLLRANLLSLHHLTRMADKFGQGLRNGARIPYPPRIGPGRVRPDVSKTGQTSGPALRLTKESFNEE